MNNAGTIPARSANNAPNIFLKLLSKNRIPIPANIAAYTKFVSNAGSMDSVPLKRVELIAPENAAIAQTVKDKIPDDSSDRISLLCISAPAKAPVALTSSVIITAFPIAL